MTLKQRAYLTPFVYGTVLVLGIVLLGLIGRGIDAVAQPCLRYTVQDKDMIRHEMTEGKMSPRTGEFVLKYIDTAPAGYIQACGRGWFYEHPILHKIQNVLMYVYFVVLIIVANWVTSLVEEVKKPTGADHVLQTIFFYFLLPFPLLSYFNSVGKPYEDEAGKLLGLGVGLAILIVANALYLGAMRLRWDFHGQFQAKSRNT